MIRRSSVRLLAGFPLPLTLLWSAAPAHAEPTTRGNTYAITRAAGPITIDGKLDDEGWKGALRISQWYEINPGNNTEPKIRNVGYVTYDDRYFYVGFDFADPDPRQIISPYGDHDAIQSNADFGGVFLDTKNEGHTAYEFQVTAHNVQFDAVMDDNGGGENASPDFFWESATRLNDHGWTLEIRIPFASLRYRHRNPQDWGIILWRNYARDFRYQFASSKQPRGSQCFVCRENTLTGLTQLPSGGHLTAAPYVAANETAQPAGGLGTPLAGGPISHKIGLDAKYVPNADNVIDGTIRPDFSQIESDTAQISTNQRFALFYPEKRPFFLEGVELLSTPIQAVYTRTVTAPDWGGRATGSAGGFAYTALVANDTGGGSLVVPGPTSSSLASQDFHSTVFVGRARKDFNGQSFVSFLATDREQGANGHNRVAGPDFQVRFHGSDTVSGQLLYSDTRTPNRPDLSASWTGTAMKSGAGQIGWSHNTTHFDFSTTYKDFGSGFRADNGFVPQVGYREEYTESGWTFRPHGFLSRLRTFVQLDKQIERDSGRTIFDNASPAAGMDTMLSGFMQFRWDRTHLAAGGQLFKRNKFAYIVTVNPTRRLQNVGVSGFLGTDVDLDNVRLGHGGAINANASLMATNHLVIDGIANVSWLDVGDAGASRRLFTARVERVRVNYSFTARSFVRLIAQYVSTDREPALYLQPATAHDGALTASVLFAYKINWQSVMFFGYGDDRTLDDQRHLQQADRQLFIKLSYALQR